MNRAIVEQERVGEWVQTPACLVIQIGNRLVAGIAAFFLEASGFPIAPAILGVVLGGMLEENFVTSMIKSDGHVLAFFERPIAATLGAMTLAVWFLPLLMRRLRRLAGIEVSA